MFKLTFDDRDGHLSDEARVIAEKICTDTVTELEVLLPALPNVVRIRMASRGRVIPQMGYGARATRPDRVSFVLDPHLAKGGARLMQEHLRPSLFHECHHLVRGWVLRGGKRRERFIDGVIHEGLTSAFERDAASHAPPWTDYPDEVRDWVDELLPLSTHASYAKWMFFHPDGRLWIGYRAGVFVATAPSPPPDFPRLNSPKLRAGKFLPWRISPLRSRHCGKAPSSAPGRATLTVGPTCVRRLHQALAPLAWPRFSIATRSLSAIVSP